MNEVEKLEELIVLVQNGEVDLTDAQVALLESYNYTLNETQSNHVLISNYVEINGIFEDLLNFIKGVELTKIIVSIENSEFLHFLMRNNCIIEDAVFVNLNEGGKLKGFQVSIEVE